LFLISAFLTSYLNDFKVLLALTAVCILNQIIYKLHSLGHRYRRTVSLE